MAVLLLDVVMAPLVVTSLVLGPPLVALDDVITAPEVVTSLWVGPAAPDVVACDEVASEVVAVCVVAVADVCVAVVNVAVVKVAVVNVAVLDVAVVVVLVAVVDVAVPVVVVLVAVPDVVVLVAVPDVVVLVAVPDDELAVCDVCGGQVFDALVEWELEECELDEWELEECELEEWDPEECEPDVDVDCLAPAMRSCESSHSDDDPLARGAPPAVAAGIVQVDSSRTVLTAATAMPVPRIPRIDLRIGIPSRPGSRPAFLPGSR